MSQLEVKWLSLVPAQPWKNGGGVTRLLAERDSDWRVSLANVEANGPYSRFDGMTRLSLIVEGKGVVLRGAERVVPLEYLLPAIYDGLIDWTHASFMGTPAPPSPFRRGSSLPSLRSRNRCEPYAMPATRSGTTHQLWR